MRILRTYEAGEVLELFATEGLNPSAVHLTRLRVGVFAGGRAAEHEVSISSAEAVLRAIDRSRYEPYLIYIDAEGRWHLPEGPAGELGSGSLAEVLGSETPEQLTDRLRTGGGQLPVRLDADRSALRARAALRSLAEAIDVAFLVVHGPFGEDGTLQGFLELADVPYTGAGVLASAVAMDKVVFKDLMRGHQLPVCDYLWYRRSAWQADPGRVEREIVERLGERSVVKPARLGSSVGMTLVHEPSELPAALDEAFRWDSKAIVEEYLANARELECGVLGNDEPVVFEPGEVISSHEFYDYEAKYVDEHGAQLVIPADIPPATLEEAQRIAVAAFRAVDCAGMARVDLFLLAEGTLVVNEINTIPGFTQISMYPKLWEASGLPYRELVDRLIRLAVERHRAEGRRGQPRT
jgi:D-alanine-D-alanine ligase